MNEPSNPTKNRKQRTENQILLAQYFTPPAIADFMSKMFTRTPSKPSILDAGAGEGVLGISLLKQVDSSSDIIFVEYDQLTYETLNDNLKTYSNHNVKTYVGDFIKYALKWKSENKLFSNIIINPPYFKLSVSSESSVLLRQNGIIVTNIYAAFMWLSLQLLKEGGEMVAIVPRSFCNGVYFKQFREAIVRNYSIDSIHIFESRDKVFSGDSVLQENIIIKISKAQQAPFVVITYSEDNLFSDITERIANKDLVLNPQDDDHIIHIPGKDQTVILEHELHTRLNELGLSVSTGPIVDFRSRDQISPNYKNGSVPLLYSQHMNGYHIEWPINNFKKAGQYYIPSESKNTFPLDGYYVAVRRFSSKEEKRRIFAAVVDPKSIHADRITFENHLNFFHIQKKGLEEDIALGLCAYLNSSILDEHFRKLSGHTQVNVGDLKKIPYPNIQQLKKIGMIVKETNDLPDNAITELILGVAK
jgi:adenine-specific DNA-methyltransferase